MADARAWLLWALTVLGVASYSRNPLYSLLLLLIALWVHETCVPEPAAFAPWRFGLYAVPLGALFNVLSSHVGATVFLRLPAWLPLLGGPLTLEALLYGAINGLNLTVIFIGFTAFNRAVTVRELVKLVPRAFHESGVALSIALTFVPQMLHNLHRIREAQAVRGHQLRGARDWIPILTPLLVGALERALGLAEALAARGYAAAAAALPGRARALLAMGLCVVLGGWLLYATTPAARALAWLVILMGAAALLSAFWLAGRAVPHTHYRPRHWRARDTWLVIGCLPTLYLLFVQRGALYYSPYPQLSWPVFDIWLSLCLLGLLTPGIVNGE